MVRNCSKNQLKKVFCIPESTNMNISHQLFEYKITFMNSRQENKNSRGDITQKPVLNVLFKDIWYTKINLTQILYDNFN